MLLKKKIVSFIFILFLFCCNTINYKFIEKISLDDKIEFEKNIKNNNPFGDSKIKFYGIYTEKDNNYKFEAFYDYKENIFKLKFYSILKNELLFEVKKEKNKIYYDFVVKSFFILKIDEIIKKFIYFIDIIPKNYQLYNTNDDYYVIVDKNKNYQKYDSYKIIKKENLFQLVKYYYEDNKIKRIEYKAKNITIFIIEGIEKYE